MFDSLLVAIARHASHIPEALLRALFMLAADIAWLLRVGGVRQLERNLSHIPDRGGQPMGHAALRRLSRHGMQSYFSYFVEAMTVGALSESQLLARVRGDGEGLASLRHLVHDNPGSAPMALGHQGNWDYAGCWAHDSLAPVTTVAERLDDKALLDVFVSIREQLGMTIMLTGHHGLTEELEEALKNPHVLVPLLADRDLGANGEFVCAFGSVIRVARGPATLAYDMNRPLYVANLHRERLHGERRRAAKTRNGYVIEIHGPVAIDQFRTLPREQAIHAISQAWVDMWSQGITEHPDDWHMLQPIFLEDLDLSRMHNVPSEIIKQAHGGSAAVPEHETPQGATVSEDDNTTQS